MMTVKVTESSSQPLSVLGIGLTSPFGVTARDHAFFLRGRLVPAMPPPFVDAEGESISAHYCRWLGARLTVAERMERMTFSALAAATGNWVEQFDSGWDVALVVEEPRIGIDDTALTAVRSAAQSLLAGKRANFSVFRGAAGCQRALVALAARLTSGQSSVGCIVAADSFLCAEALAEEARVPVTWRPQTTPLSEAAAALVVIDERRTPSSTKPLGRLLHSAAVRGLASEMNDEIVDGYALTYLLREMPELGGALPAVFGPRASDALRLRDWHLAAGRNARRFCDPYVTHDLESSIGRIGSASGVAHLAYGLACLHFRTLQPIVEQRALALSWSLSRDGWRGITLLQGENS